MTRFTDLFVLTDNDLVGNHALHGISYIPYRNGLIFLFNLQHTMAGFIYHLNMGVVKMFYACIFPEAQLPIVRSSLDAINQMLSLICLLDSEALNKMVNQQEQWFILDTGI